MIALRHVGEARIVSRRALRYADGGDARTGRPAHVRAASGLAWQKRNGERVLVAPQDDTSFLAVFAPPDGAVSALVLDYAPGEARVFEKRTSTKQLKLDLESIAAIDDERALLVGSGSHENRCRIVVLEGTRTRIVDCTALYETLRARTDFAGSELNLEGAARIGDTFYLANRGNGAGDAVDALAALSLPALMAYLEGMGPVPAIERVVPFDLGLAAGARLTFTDLAAHDGALWFLACAEKSPNAYDDGEVVGAALGRIDLARGEGTLALLIAEDGTPSRDKPEGLAMRDASTAYACIDADDPDVPSSFVTISA